jgi:Ca2+-binding RTX toxin-like protein
LEGAARSDHQTIAALQKGGAALTALIDSLPSAKIVGTFKLGPLDGVAAALAIYNEFRNGDGDAKEVFGEVLKQAASTFGSGLAGAAASAIVTGALGVSATALAPVVVAGAVSIGVGLAIDKAWEHHGDSITDWTVEQLVAGRDSVTAYSQQFDQWVDQQYGNLGDYVTTTADAFNTWLDNTAQSAVEMADFARAHASELGDDAVKFFEDTRDAVVNDIVAAKNQAAQWAAETLDAGRELWADSQTWAREAFDWAKDNLTDFTSASENWLDNRLSDLGGITRDLGNCLGNLLEQINPLDLLRPQTGELIDELKGLFKQAEETRSPIILDLDGDGVETLGVGSNIHFDHDGNGFAELTGWAGADDGLLVFDRNGNSKVDNGGELFGNYTALGRKFAKNGFAALRALDGNADGVISNADADFGNLRVWKDGNSNGVTDTGELFTLAQLGIESLSTGYEIGNFTDPNGNDHLQFGEYKTTGQQTRDMTDVWFSIDTSRTLDKDIVDVPADLGSLPDMSGSGNVSSLHQAMAKDASGLLQDLIKKYASTIDANARSAMLNEIVYRWAGVEDIDPESRAATQIYGNVIGDARKLASLEAFIGDDYVGIWCWGELDANPHGPAAKILLDAFGRLADYVGSQLDAQTRFSDLYDKIALNWDSVTSTLKPDVEALVRALRDRYLSDEIAATIDFSQFTAGLKYAGAFGQQVLEALRAEGDVEGTGFWLLLATAGLTSTVGDNNNSFIIGSAGAEVLLGLGGDDQLHGGAGNDRLVGGVGDDWLSGGEGADTYVFNRGDGHDTINNWDGDVDGAQLDVIEFREGIVPDDIEVTRSYFDLVLKISGSTDQITISSFLDGAGLTGYAVDLIRFADGTEWTVAQIMAWLNKPTPGDDYVLGTADDDVIDTGDGNDNIQGGDGNDSIAGSAGNDWIYGGSGNDDLDGGADSDWLYGEAGNDTLNGLGGDDTIYGEVGNDTLSGGTGEDYLVGGYGSDIYRFDRGGGHDTIDNYAWSDSDVAGKVDALVFGTGILTSDVTARRQGDTLVLSISGTDDRVTVQSYFAGSDYRLDEIRFKDGTVWDYHDVQAFVTQGSEGDDDLVGGDSTDTLDGLGGNDTIYGEAGHDTLSGGAGMDSVYGGAGNDKINGGLDDDYLIGEAGNDTLSGGTGNDYLDGGHGSDTYQVDLGGGHDTISNYGWAGYDVAGKVDALLFGTGIRTSDVTARRWGSDLLLTHANGDDQVTVSGYFDGDSYRLDEIRFKDGTVWDYDDVQAFVTQGSEGDDYLVGGDSTDTLNGLGGDDTISGEVGNDTLSGGTGEDYLIGGYGSDIYRFDRGGGHDTIDNYAWSDADVAGKVDALVFGTGILTSDVTARRQGDTLVLSIVGTDDRVTVQSYFAGSDYRLDEIRFKDGTVWDYHDVQAFVTQGSEGDDDLVGGDSTDTLNGLGGNDTIYGEAGHDTLSGGAGMDSVYGGAGNDKINGGLDDDYLIGEAGNDTLSGGTGNDYLDGGHGSDTYQVDLGGGHDTISNYEWASYDVAGNVDALLFGTGIRTSDVTARRWGSDLLLTHANGDDQVTVAGYFDGDSDRLDEIRFKDGTVWDDDDVQAFVTQGSEGDDDLVGGDSTDTLDGLGGNDTIYGEAGHDTLSGGAGMDSVYGGAGNDKINGGVDDDYLIGEAGNDTLSDGTGNDYLDGGHGSDTYQVDLGGGHDTISNYEWASYDVAGNVDALLFGTGIRTSDVTARRWGSDLLLTHANGDDQVTVAGYFDGDSDRLDEIRFKDGTIWDYDDVQVLVTDEPNLAPASLALAGSTVKENVAVGTTVGAFSATDPERAALTYKLTDTAGGLFKLSGTKLLTAKTIDYETVRSDTVTLEVADASGLKTTTTFTIGVTDLIETKRGTTKSDTMNGGVGADKLIGLAGADKLYGGKGFDELYGGSGKDIFVFKRTSDLGTSKTATDTIFDFVQKEGDVIDLSAIDAKTSGTSNDVFKLIGAAAFTRKQGEVHYEKKASDTFIYGDVNGDGKPDFVIRLDDAISIKSSDFIL